MAANLLDVAADGVAWNMFPLPGTDIWFNAADAWIVAGSLLLTGGMVREFRRLGAPGRRDAGGR